MACRCPSRANAAAAVAALLVLTALPTAAQIVAAPPARGLSGETTVTAGGSVVIYQVGLAGLVNKGQLQSIDLRLSPLAAPLQAGLDAGDITRLRLVASRNNHFGDGNDVDIASVAGADLDLTGGVTTITPSGTASLGLLPAPVGHLLRFYFVVADIAPGAVGGHALRVGADAGHVHTSLGDVGLAIVADNADRVVVDGLTPVFAVPALRLDVGDVDVGSSGSASLTVRNDGAADLTISAVGVDDARFAAAPTAFTVAPGGSRDVTVEFTPTGAGTVSATLTVRHDGDGSPASISLTATGVAAGVPDLTASPAPLDFGDVALGSSSSLDVTVTNPGTAPATITGVSADSPQFQATPTAFVLGAGQQQAVTVRYTPSAAGAVAASLSFTGASAPAAVPLTGTGVPARPVLSLQSVAFGNITFGETGRTTLRLTNEGSADIDITDIAADDGQFTASPRFLRLAPGASANVELRFDPTSLGTKTATLSIAYGGAAPLQVPLRADATVRLRDQRLDFGRVEPGRSVVLAVPIDNPSGAPVTITSVVSDNPRFVPARTTFDIPANGTGTLRVTFTPRDGLPDIARLSVTHNPTVTITLVGNERGSVSQPTQGVGRPLPETQVPFGGEWLGGLLIVLYGLRRRR